MLCYNITVYRSRVNAGCGIAGGGNRPEGEPLCDLFDGQSDGGKLTEAARRTPCDTHHSKSSLRDNAARAYDPYLLRRDVNYNWLGAVIITVHQRVDQHFLQGKAVIGIRGTRHFLLQAKSGVHKRQQIRQCVEL